MICVDLWIRSQDKKRLIKTNILELSTYEPNKLILTEEDIGKGDCKIFANEHIYIGTYKTKERALEVLDNLQQYLSADFEFKATYEEVDILIKTKMLNGLYGVIYNMPKE